MMRTKVLFCVFLAATLLCTSKALEEEEEDPGRPGSDIQNDEPFTESPIEQILYDEKTSTEKISTVETTTAANNVSGQTNRRRHQKSRLRNSDRSLRWFDKQHPRIFEGGNTLDEINVEKKKRRRRKRLRHKKSKFSSDLLFDGQMSQRQQRRKYLRRNESLMSNSRNVKSGKGKRPNIVLIMTDDQDVELGSLQFMPKLNKYLRKEGATFDYGFVSTPMCCPSRSSMLTGLYVHNHNVLTNNDNCSSPMWIEKHEPRTFGKYLSDAGYKTGYFGKYLNKYNGNRIPVGWDEWTGLVRNSRFYNYTLNVNGNKVKHGWDYSKDYFPDLITNDSLAFFRQSKQRRPSQPVLMVMSFPGPHGPEDSAPQFSDLFFNVTTHHTPAYDYAPNPDKQWVLQVTERMEPVHKKFTDFLMTKRLQTLQSIDEAVERLYHELDALGELENTYIFYTSDHGYHLGQFGLVKGKSFPFDVDTKVPFIVRGPGIEWGSTLPEPVVNIDLAPTFLDLAGVHPLPAHMDGRSIVPLLNRAKSPPDESEETEPWRHAFLIERGKMTTHRYQKIQQRDENSSNGSATSIPPLPNATFFFDDEDEALEDDDDKHVTISDEEDQLEESSALFEKDRLTKQERLAVECLKPRLQAPCQLYQRHKCVRKKNGLWKIKRCHSHLGYQQGSSSVMIPSYDDLIDDVTEECVCEGDGDNFYSLAEKRLQRRFIKKHLANHAVRLRHKFINDFEHEDVTQNHRRKRQSANESQDPASPDVDSVLTEMAEQEIDEVDIIMDDINEEIQDLQDSMVVDNSTKVNSSNSVPNELQCQLVSERKVNCSSQVYSNKDAWRSSRSYINDQIRRLRAQLSELKEIRKHLKKKRPYDMFDQPGTSAVIDPKAIYGEQQTQEKKKCICKKLSRKERHLREREERRKQRDKLKLARLQRRLRRKEQKRKLKKEKKKRKKDSCSVDSEKLNCFSHNNDHWKTAPLWTDGSFCACTNSNTNTYSCVRNINVTHNYLYCEFISGTITYYDLRIDPHQLRNIYQTLSYGELNYMHKQLIHLKKYKGQNDIDSVARKVMAEFGNPAQISKKTPIPTELEVKRGNSGTVRQRKFIRKYGQFLPPANAYHQRW